jgi:hypothetical protein
MATIKCHLTLEEDVVARLELEGRGKGAKYQAKGIEALIMKLDMGAPHHKPAAHRPGTFNLPDSDDDTSKPKPDMRVVKGQLLRAEKAAAEAKEAYDKPRRAFRSEIRDTLANPSRAHQQPAIFNHFEERIPYDEMVAIRDEVCIDADGSIAQERNAWIQATQAREQQQQKEAARRKELMDSGMTFEEAVAQLFKEDGVTQTLRLSTKALKGLGMFGTPLTMTDAQIREINADWEHRDLPPEDEEVTEL